MQLVHRVKATQATVDRFLGVPFAWGTNDCAHLVAFHLRQLGYDDPLKEFTPWGTARNAKRSMRKAGYASIPDFFDRRFERIAPATCVEGDIIAIPASETDPNWVALGVFVGNGRVLAFAHDRCLWSDPEVLSVVTHAWRTPRLPVITSYDGSVSIEETV